MLWSPKRREGDQGAMNGCPWSVTVDISTAQLHTVARTTTLFNHLGLTDMAR